MRAPRRAWCRTFQAVFRLALPFLPYHEPVILESTDALSDFVRARRVSSVLLVTDTGIASLGLHTSAVRGLEEAGIEVVVYAETVANPTTDNVEDALGLYHLRDCGAIIGFGGGSAMDCAKGVAARVARPKKSLGELKGLLRVHARTPLLVAVPTTAGTGSEVTLAAVITDAREHHKYVINDFALIPDAAVHDWRLTEGLPAAVTAQTGMDALTHAVEAYIGRSTNAFTRSCAEEAVSLIRLHLEDAYANPHDGEARRGMLRAAYLAGNAFTRSYVGYVHGIAHSLGGRYGTPHGLANAVALPHVLRAYGPAAHGKLARLARASGVVDDSASPLDDAEAAGRFIEWICGMNETLGIPEHLDCIVDADIVEMADHADAESNPLYPVPVLFDAGELAALYRTIAGDFLQHVRA